VFGKASAEKQALDFRVAIAQILTDIQQARAVVHAFGQAPPLDATWPVITMGLAPSLDLAWLASPWLPGRAKRGRRQHDWWIQRLFKAIGINKKAQREAVQDRVERLRDHIANNERKVSQLVDELRRSMFNNLTEDYNAVCLASVAQDTQECRKIRNILTLHQRAEALAADFGVTTTRATRQANAHCAINPGSTAALVAEAVSSWRLSGDAALDSEQVSRLTERLHAVRVRSEAMRTEIYRMMLTARDEIAADVSEEGGGWFDHGSFNERYHALYRECIGERMKLLKALRTSLSPIQRATIAQQTRPSQDDPRGLQECSLREAATMRMPGGIAEPLLAWYWLVIPVLGNGGVETDLGRKHVSWWLDRAFGLLQLSPRQRSNVGSTIEHHRDEVRRIGERYQILQTDLTQV